MTIKLQNNHRFRRVLFFGMTVLSCWRLPVEAWAEDLPGSADPGRFDERFQGDLPIRIPDIRAPKEIILDDQMVDAEQGFVLNGIAFKGATVFPDSELQGRISKYVGRTVDLDSLNLIADVITKFYRDNGYFLAKAVVPAQNVDNGIVEIVIIEGFIADVQINDPHHLLDKNGLKSVEGLIQKIRDLNPLHGPTLERQPLLVCRSPHINAKRE